MCLELAWLLLPRNLSADSYRLRERRQALAEWGRQRTPETRAVWDREYQLLQAHQQRTAMLVTSAILVEGVALIFIVRRSILGRHENAS